MPKNLVSISRDLGAHCLGVASDRVAWRGRLPNLYYSVRETRALLGQISHATVYRLINAGRLDARKLAGKTVITGDSIERLADELPPIGARSDRGVVASNRLSREDRSRSASEGPDATTGI